jgi:hypothetical protein
MKILKFILVFITTSNILGQDKNESIKFPAITLDEDTIFKEYTLEPVNIYARPKEAITLSTRDQAYLKKVYPYALRVARIVKILDNHLADLDKNRQKSKYLNEMESLLKKEFSDDLKNLTRIQGQMLTKLVYRETNRTIYQLLKDYKSGFSAGWWNMLGKIYDQDLKMEYEPYGKDHDIEVYVQYLDDLYLKNGLKETINNEKYSTPIQGKKRKG